MFEKELYPQIFVEMGKRVGLNWQTMEDVEAYQRDNGVTWYNTQRWSKQDSKDFQRWLREYLAQRTQWSEYKIRWEVATFMLCYSWTTSQSV